MCAWTVILVEAHGPLNLVRPTRNDFAAGTSSVDDEPVASHAAAHASTKAFAHGTHSQHTSGHLVYASIIDGERARAYLGVVRGPVAESTVVLDVEHAVHPAGGGYEHTTALEADEEQIGSAEDADDTLHD